jgi:hypothetical protein
MITECKIEHNLKLQKINTPSVIFSTSAPPSHSSALYYTVASAHLPPLFRPPNVLMTSNLPHRNHHVNLLHLLLPFITPLPPPTLRHQM